LSWKIAGYLVFLLLLPALLVRRQEPFQVMIWCFATAIAFNAAVSMKFGHPGGLMTTAVVLVTIYAVYRWAAGRVMLWATPCILAVWVIGNLVDNEGIGDWIGGFIGVILPIQAALIVRYRTANAERAADEIRHRERQMLARELHDSVAHHVSAIAVQAQAGQAMAVHDPTQAVAVLSVIEEAAARTLNDMRQMIGALRDEDGAELLPQQGIQDLSRLAATAPGDLAGHVDIHPDLGSVGTAAGAAIFRIAQESITNSARHARSATTVNVTVAPDGSDVALTIVDDGKPAPRREGGFGLRGMAERAQLLGGSFAAGPVRGSGWHVRATIPRTPA